MAPGQSGDAECSYRGESSGTETCVQPSRRWQRGSNPALSVPAAAQEPVRRLRGPCFLSRARVMALSIFSEDGALLPARISAVKWACS